MRLGLVGFCSDVVESSCLVYLYILGLLEATIVQVNVSNCLFLVLGNLIDVHESLGGPGTHSSGPLQIHADMQLTVQVLSSVQGKSG